MLLTSRAKPSHAGLSVLFSSLLCASLSFTSFGCGDETDDEHDHDAHVHESTGDASDAGHTGDAGDNACKTSGLSEGQMAHGDNVMVKLVSFDNNPAQIQENDWVVEISTHDGTPVADAELTNVRAFMPVHGHDGKYPPEISAVSGEPGQFKLDDLYFTMEGPWQVQFTIASESAGDDYVVMEICVGG